MIDGIKVSINPDHIAIIEKYIHGSIQIKFFVRGKGHACFLFVEWEHLVKLLGFRKANDEFSSGTFFRMHLDCSTVIFDDLI